MDPGSPCFRRATEAWDDRMPGLTGSSCPRERAPMEGGVCFTSEQLPDQVREDKSGRIHFPAINSAILRDSLLICWSMPPGDTY
ncbi:MAG: hypothetical protein KJO98_13665, partial [Rhodothermia bacterium]|nr:hypothetical protein [Rhodothermia bacterium]